MIQFISTPLHLLGLDLYNRPASGPAGAVVTMRDRWDLIRRNWFISSIARICRIVPAFGVGGVVNMKVRKNLMSKLEVEDHAGLGVLLSMIALTAAPEWLVMIYGIELAACWV
ncbi:hypothetical protein NM208_g15950 [Fusarium decemcellulare]|uniref:Uncharacterized protein n=1 Tax=Fusarium decemcellulare TaxID=57161 RepID=A0ACC1RDF1_9HYPO|nr:hypothetical protein NM208_g15950 [Fusarium decemcellulare]